MQCCRPVVDSAPALDEPRRLEAVDEPDRPRVRERENARHSVDRRARTPFVQRHERLRGRTTADLAEGIREAVGERQAEGADQVGIAC